MSRDIPTKFKPIYNACTKNVHKYLVKGYEFKKPKDFYTNSSEYENYKLDFSALLKYNTDNQYWLTKEREDRLYYCSYKELKDELLPKKHVKKSFDYSSRVPFFYMHVLSTFPSK